MAGESKPLVSIVVPVYNVEKYLKQCLDSIIAQTYKNIEIILIDDGSTDNSGQICDEYAENDARIRVLHKENKGVSAARNSGIEMASGEYLIFVDSDDQIHKQMIDIYMKHLELESVLVCQFSETEDMFSVSYLEQCEYEIQIFDRINFIDFFASDYVHAPWNKLYDVTLIKEHRIRFDETMSIGEDFLFNLEYFKYAPQKYKIIPCALYYYRCERDGSLVNSYRAEIFASQLCMYNSLQDFLENYTDWNKSAQKLFYGIVWDRLYLTIRIFQAYAKKNSDGRIQTVISDSLNHSCWQSVEHECWNLGLMNWKRILKKLYLEILRRW